MTSPRIIDDDHDTITAIVNGEDVRGWEYRTEDERRVKMRMAHEFAEGWFQAEQNRKKAVELRTHQMNSELPLAEQEMLRVKGMI